MADLGQIGAAQKRTEIVYGGTISGVVKDNSGNFVVHRLLAFEIAGGSVTGGAYSRLSDGAYTIRTNFTTGRGLQFVVDFPSTAEFNARILHNIQPA